MAAIIRVTGVGPAPSRKARVLRSKGFPGIPKSIADGGAHAADRRPTCSQNTFFAFCSRGEACLARFKSLSQFAPTEIESTRIEKGIFTAEEISKLLEKANLDWRGAILVGYFTGARLKDVCNLRWSNVDLEKRLITFRAGKTGQLITVAIHPELEEHLLSGNTSDDPQAFLFRSLAGKSGGGKSGLSMAFKRIMEQAEVDAGVARLSSGAKGRSFSLRSFHSLRHSFIQR